MHLPPTHPNRGFSVWLKGKSYITNPWCKCQTLAWAVTVVVAVGSSWVQCPSLPPLVLRCVFSLTILHESFRNVFFAQNPFFVALNSRSATIYLAARGDKVIENCSPCASHLNWNCCSLLLYPSVQLSITKQTTIFTFLFCIVWKSLVVSSCGLFVSIK